MQTTLANYSKSALALYGARQCADVVPELRWQPHSGRPEEFARAAHDPCQLSEREHEVLRWTALGKTSDEVAVILGISTRTVTFHVSEILAKLDAKNKVHAAVKALMLNILHLP